MKFIKNLCRRFPTWVHGDNYKSDATKMSAWTNITSSKRPTPIPMSHHELTDGRALNFKVYSAVGGKVIQFNTYNEKTDTSRSSLYVITEQEDLGKELAEIITVECLAR